MVQAHQQSYSISAQMIPRTAIFFSLDAINHLDLPHLDPFAGSESTELAGQPQVHQTVLKFNPSLASGQHSFARMDGKISVICQLFCQSSILSTVRAVLLRDVFLLGELASLDWKAIA